MGSKPCGLHLLSYRNRPSVRHRLGQHDKRGNSSRSRTLSTRVLSESKQPATTEQPHHWLQASYPSKRCSRMRSSPHTYMRRVPAGRANVHWLRGSLMVGFLGAGQSLRPLRHCCRSSFPVSVLFHPHAQAQDVEAVNGKRSHAGQARGAPGQSLR